MTTSTAFIGFVCLFLTASLCLSSNEVQQWDKSIDRVACKSFHRASESQDGVSMLQGKVAFSQSDVAVHQSPEEEQRTIEVDRLSKVDENPQEEANDKGGTGGAEKPTESSIWSDQVPLLTGNLEEQAEFCKTHPQAGWDKDRMRASIELVRALTKALRNAGVPPMIMEGTLLSFIRQGFLINGDSDIDFWLPRQFMNTPDQWNSFQQAMKDQSIECGSDYQQYAAGWKIYCYPKDGSPSPGWKLSDSDSKGFYIDISVFDEGSDGCQSSPCTWTQYLTVEGKTYPGIYGPFNWRLASWHNVSLWVPENPEVTLADSYTAKWKETGKANYNFWMQNAPISEEKQPSYFHNRLDLNAPNILKLQQRLEKENEKQMEDDARKQWTLAMDLCAMKTEENKRTVVDNGQGKVSLLQANVPVHQSSPEEVYKGTVFYNGQDKGPQDAKMMQLASAEVALATDGKAHAALGQQIPGHNASRYSKLEVGILGVDIALAAVACQWMFSNWRRTTASLDLGLPTVSGAAIFLIYIALNVGHMFLQQRAGKTGYSVIAATLLLYFCKTVVSFFMFLCKGDVWTGLSSLLGPGCTRFGKLQGCLLPLIPGCLFAGYDALSFVALQHIDPPTYHIFMRMRIVLVGFLWQICFQRKLSAPQWLAFILILAAGLTKGLGTATMNNAQLAVVGICIVMTMNCMSAFASVSSEVLLKEMPMPIDLVNTCTYLWGMVCLAIVLLSTEGLGALYLEVLSPSAWAKLWADPWMMGAICCLTAFGIITSYLLKELSNIMKEIAGGAVIVVATVSQGIISISTNSTLGLTGASMAVLGIVVYSSAPLKK